MCGYATGLIGLGLALSKVTHSSEIVGDLGLLFNDPAPCLCRSCYKMDHRNECLRGEKHWVTKSTFQGTANTDDARQENSLSRGRAS